MFCPSCGLADANNNQYCRACGTDLRSVRSALEKPDTITASATTAREEIGRAVAARIRETTTANELKKVAEDVLPQIEKFLESPEERRLRGIRAGMIVTGVGVGAAIAFTLVSIFMLDREVLMLAGGGVVTFFIGLSIVLNSLYFTVPKKSLSDKSEDAQSQRRVDILESKTNDLILPPENKDHVFSSVIEDTTRHLKENEPIPRR